MPMYLFPMPMSHHPNPLSSPVPTPRLSSVARASQAVQCQQPLIPTNVVHPIYFLLPFPNKARQPFLFPRGPPSSRATNYTSIPNYIYQLIATHPVPPRRRDRPSSTQQEEQRSREQTARKERTQWMRRSGSRV